MPNEATPRALVLQDLSCLGRCSLTVALPTLALMGVQAVPLPTAVFSTHTGGFGRPARRDLTDFLQETLAHYRALGLRFDAVLTGYLARAEQADLAEQLLAWQSQALRVVDPAMADHGHLYSGLDEAMPARMRALCEHADVITPNWTELQLLAGVSPLSEEAVSEEELSQLCARLPGRAAVVTGVPLEKGPANAVYEREKVTLFPYKQLPAAYPGTGDLFAAHLTGRLLRGESLPRAAEGATRALSRVIARTLEAGTPPREGVLLELDASSEPGDCFV